MKSWGEAKIGMVVYVKTPIEFEGDNGNTQATKPFQKAKINGSVEGDCTAIIIDGGVADGYDFYFYHKESNPSDLLTSAEYKKLKKKKFEVLENGNKCCPKCGEEVEFRWKVAFEKEWCPCCGYGLIK